MGRRIYLVRHGLTDWNLMKRFQGKLDIPLNDTGRDQAKALTDRFKDILPFDIVVTSPLIRAKETAEIIAGGNSNLIVDNDIREINFGDWEGLNFDQIKEKFPVDAEKWSKSCDMLCVSNGESMQALFDRVWPRFLYWSGRSDYNNLCMVCHGGVLGAMLCGITKSPLSMMTRYISKNTAVTEIEINEDGTWNIIRLNDSGHLE